MKIRWSQILGVVLPILGVVIEVVDSINQSKLQEQEMLDMEQRIVEKYGLTAKESDIHED